MWVIDKISVKELIPVGTREAINPLPSISMSGKLDFSGF
jgi:hypothetical protein